ncbi:PEP-CTERM sorting domain-containing protein [Roseateles koreensis]|uniref:PEP-CTERM sorting domain-containing protein n=1 Tax=Roseateles koreensis TaxID=2987526 RepID=A0ABT5KM36_9BURK|nr:PEP-CTERM sorting domain-containing protein [Roseateles koreensis]MDC8783971.1 PEP-CTERM sorting domain-containing protein [Roseateles koreensis]
MNPQNKLGTKMSYFKSVFIISSMMLSGLANAAPTVSNLTSGFSLTHFTPAMSTSLGNPALGTGALNKDSTLFWVDEKTVNGQKSYYISFEPGQQQNIFATLNFGSKVLAVYDTAADLASTTSTYGASGINYGTSNHIGEEVNSACASTPTVSDTTFDCHWVSGNTVSLNWRADGVGDAIRVLVAASPVPEPSTMALMFGGLFAVGAIARRRAKA